MKVIVERHIPNHVPQHREDAVDGYIHEIRGYDSATDRKRAIAMLMKHGFDSFTCYRDVRSAYALLFARTFPPDGCYINW